MANDWLVSVDPGKRACGVCVYDAQGVRKALLVEEPGAEASVLARLVLVAVERSGAPLKGLAWKVERPRKYEHASDKHHDLEALEAVNAEVAKLARKAGGKVTFYYPSQWKGNVPKGVCEARIRSVLSPEEIARIQDNHNVWDAVGIGLVANGRLARGLIRRR